MDGDHALSATVIDEFTHEGKTYRLGVLTRSDWANIERDQIKDRPDPLAVILPHLAQLPESQQTLLLEKAYEDARLGKRMRAGEMELFMMSWYGQRLRFACMIRKHHPELTAEECDALFEIMAKRDVPQLSEDLEAGSGFPSGKESGPPTDGDDEASPGGPSIDSSKSDIAGHPSKSDA